MPTAGLVFGLISLIGAVVAFIPCLGWMNWLILVIALLGMIFSGVGIGSAKKAQAGMGQAVAGLVLSLLAFIGGGIRLFLGGGVL